MELYEGINRWASDPLANANTFAFPVLFATFLFIAYILLYALTFGVIRGIPFWWRLIDGSFGVFGFVPLWLCRKWTRELASLGPEAV